MPTIRISNEYQLYLGVGKSAYSLFSLESNAKKLECGPMPNVTAALPNIGGTLCSTPQTLADAHY